MDETETKNKMEKQHNGIDRRERNGMRKKRRRKRKKKRTVWQEDRRAGV